MIDALSMRDFVPYSLPGLSESGEDHFFQTFGRFASVANAHTGETLAEVASRAGRQNESYLELTVGFDRDSGAIGSKTGWSDNFDEEREKLNSAGIRSAIAGVLKILNDAEAEKDQLLKCRDAAHADPGCRVAIRYIYEVFNQCERMQSGW